MKLLEKASLRHLKRHPAQLTFSVLGVTLGVAVVVAMDLAILSSREAFRLSAETVAGRATHSIVGVVGDLDEDLLPRLKIDLGVREAAPVVEGLATSSLLPGLALRVVGVDPFSEAPFRTYFAGTGGGGSALDVGAVVGRTGGALLAARTASTAGLAVGDSFPVQVDGRESALRLVGVLDPEDPLATAGVRDVVLVDIATAQELFGTFGLLTRIDLRLAGDDAGALLEAVRAALPETVRIEAAGTRTDLLRGMIGAFDLNLTALSLLALVFGMFLIYNAMTFSVVQRRALLGGLRALGVTRQEVIGTVVREAVWVGAAGATAGTLLGVILGRGLVGMVTQTVNDLYFVVAVDGLAVPAASLAKGIAVGIGATVLAALPAASEAASTTPRAAQLRSVQEEGARRSVPKAAGAGVVAGGLGLLLLGAPTASVGVGFASLFLMMLGCALLAPAWTVLFVAAVRPVMSRMFGVLGTMAARGVVASLSRTAPAVAALVIAVSVTVGLGVMIESFRGTLSRWLSNTLRADVYVSLPSSQASRAEGTLDPELVTAFVDHPEVVGHSLYRGRELRLDDAIVRLVALDLDPRGERAFDFVDDAGPETFAAFRAGGAVLVSEPFAFRRRVGVGDSVGIPTPRGTRAFAVAGVFYDYGSDQGVVMVSRRAYLDDHADEGVTSLALFLAEGAEPPKVVRELEGRAAGSQTVVVRTSGALRDGSLAVFERTFRITGVLRLLAFIVAFVGVLAAFMALELERARELGVLRANGLTPRQLWGLITSQTGLLGVISGLLAVPLGLILSVVMIQVVNKRSFGWSLRMELSPEVVLQAIGLALAGSLLAGLYPAWRMARASPASALRDDA